MKKPNIFIACDTTNTNVIKKIISDTKTKKLNIGYKFGLEFFYWNAAWPKSAKF